VKSVAAQQAIQKKISRCSARPMRLRQSNSGLPMQTMMIPNEGRTWWITKLPLALLALLQRTVCVRKVGRLNRHAVLMHGRWAH
jgi:hypothetical protein